MAIAKKNKKVFVGISGGVDSSVAALLLKRQGYEVVGVFLRGFNVDGCQDRDAEDARRVAAQIEVPFYVWDCEEDYKRAVVEYMVNGYRRGLTPNPDVMCNKEIKFGIFLDKALALGTDYVATGHYVRLKKAQKSNRASFALQSAKDNNKDQSYFLWTLTQQQLRHSLFPIGNYLKSQVREIARKEKLHNAGKKDSQGICFLGKVSLEDFLQQYLPLTPGKIITHEGEKIGEHKGVPFYTVGQRHGLGMGGGKPYYVAQKDARANTLTVAAGSDHLSLYKRNLALISLHWTSGKTPRGSQEVMARIRYRQPLSKALLRSKGKGYILEFTSPQKFVAPGQSAVLYSNRGEVLGGGIIS